MYITESVLTGKPVERRVDYTLGNRRIQHYLTTIEHGRIVVLPPSWDVQRREWFDSVEIVRPPTSRTPTRCSSGTSTAVGCHVSQQDNPTTPATRTYDTTWVDFGTACERCHGPGSAHVAAHAAPGAPRRRRRPPIVRPTRSTPPGAAWSARSAIRCATRWRPDFRAGEDYYDYFVPKLEYTPRKEQDPAYWADGRPRRFSNDAIGLWQSRCFLARRR